LVAVIAILLNANVIPP